MPIASRAASSLAGVPPDRRQEVDGHCAEARDSDPPGDVARMLVEAAILVDDEDGGLERTRPRFGDIGLVAADELLGPGGQARVVGRDDGGRGGGGGDRADQRLGCRNAAGERDHPRHENAPVETVVREAVVEEDRFLLQLLVHMPS